MHLKPKLSDFILPPDFAPPSETENYYLDFLVAISMKQNLFQQCIQDVFIVISVLFLDYSMVDWNFRVLFRTLSEYLRRGTCRKHQSVQIVTGSIYETQKERTLKYLDRYFARFHIHIDRDDCREYATEFKTQWEAFNRGN
jgi:hypothetical protein